MEKYEDPTQRLQSKVPSEEYKSNYDKIFGKKKYWYEKQLELDLGETDGNKLGSSGEGKTDMDKSPS